MKKNLSYRDAINLALHQEMERDERVFAYGVDVGDHKRIFGSTNNLVEQFGSERCFSTPICEDTLVGFGLGAALAGMRPVNIHMRLDFLLLATNQLFNMVSSYRYGTGGQLDVPLVIRAVIGKGWGQAYQHSKSLQGMFAHIPGLKVVMPTTPNDAKCLLASAIRDNNPVVVIEHRFLYDVEGEVNLEPEIVPLGEPSVLREGRDVTIVATSWMNVEAVSAADILKRKHGIDAEIIDCSAIAPLNPEKILQSVAKTGHCIIADYDWTYCGFSAELATIIYEGSLGKLQKPVARLGFKPTPCPTTRPLEDEFYPNAIDLIRMVENLFDRPEADLSHETFYSYENKFKGPF